MTSRVWIVRNAVSERRSTHPVEPLGRIASRTRTHIWPFRYWTLLRTCSAFRYSSGVRYEIGETTRVALDGPRRAPAHERPLVGLVRPVAQQLALRVDARRRRRAGRRPAARADADDNRPLLGADRRNIGGRGKGDAILAHLRRGRSPGEPRAGRIAVRLMQQRAARHGAARPDLDPHGGTTRRARGKRDGELRVGGDAEDRPLGRSGRDPRDDGVLPRSGRRPGEGGEQHETGGGEEEGGRAPHCAYTGDHSRSAWP